MTLTFQASDAQDTSGVELASVSSPTCFPEPRFTIVSRLPPIHPESCWARTTVRAKFKSARKCMACSRGLTDSATLGSFGQRQLWEVTKSVFQPSKILIVRKRKGDL